MRRRMLLVFGFTLAFVLVVWLEPTRIFWGWLNGESFFKGRPTSYWARAVEVWQPHAIFM